MKPAEEDSEVEELLSVEGMRCSRGTSTGGPSSSIMIAEVVAAPGTWAPAPSASPSTRGPSRPASVSLLPSRSDPPVPDPAACDRTKERVPASNAGSLGSALTFLVPAVVLFARGCSILIFVRRPATAW